MAKLINLIFLAAFTVLVCSVSDARQRQYSDGRYNPHLNDPKYLRNYYRNRNYYDNRRFFDSFYKRYNPHVVPYQARILDVRNSPNVGDGVYSYSYETENGIHGEERGYPIPTGNNRQKEQVEGAFSYLTPEGVRVGVKYIADENGYHPTITYDGVNAAFYANQQAPASVVLTRIN